MPEVQSVVDKARGASRCCPDMGLPEVPKGMVEKPRRKRVSIRDKMKETPLIYSTDNVIRILKGLKTQTRRTRGLNQINKNPNAWEYQGLNKFGQHLFYPTGDYPDEFDGLVKCPFGGVGDLIWVKETYYTFQAGGQAVLYKANLAWEKEERPKPAEGWMPAMFMFKRFARLWLELTEPCRLERLQDISGIDCVAEGFIVYPDMPAGDAERQEFATEWDSLNAKRGCGWGTNLWVWVITSKALGVRLK